MHVSVCVRIYRCMSFIYELPQSMCLNDARECVLLLQNVFSYYVHHLWASIIDVPQWFARYMHAQDAGAKGTGGTQKVENVCEKRPMYTANETYIYSKRDLLFIFLCQIDFPKGWRRQLPGDYAAVDGERKRSRGIHEDVARCTFGLTWRAFNNVVIMETELGSTLLLVLSNLRASDASNIGLFCYRYRSLLL